MLMSVLTEAFRNRGLRAVLVGGSAIEVLAPGAHLSDDTDVVVTGPTSDVPLHEQAAAVMESLGFQRAGMGWSLGDLFVHLVGYQMDDPTVSIDMGTLRFEIVQREVPLADRIIGFKHWPGATAYGTQALQMLASYGESLDEAWLRERLHKEQALDALDALRAVAARGDVITDDLLQQIHANLLAGRAWDALETL